MPEEGLATIYDELESIWRHIQQLEDGLEQTLSEIAEDISRIDSEITSLSDIIDNLNIAQNFQNSNKVLNFLNDEIEKLKTKVIEIEEIKDRLNRLEYTVNNKINELIKEQGMNFQKQTEDIEKKVNEICEEIVKSLNAMKSKIDTHEKTEISKQGKKESNMDNKKIIKKMLGGDKK